MLSEKLISVLPETNTVSLISHSGKGDEFQQSSFKNLLVSHLSKSGKTQLEGARVGKELVNEVDVETTALDEASAGNENIIGLISNDVRANEGLHDVSTSEGLHDVEATTSNSLDSELKLVGEFTNLTADSNDQVSESILQNSPEQVASLNDSNYQNPVSALSLELAKIDGTKSMKSVSDSSLEYAPEDNDVALSKVNISKNEFTKSGISIVANAAYLNSVGNSSANSTLTSVSQVSEAFKSGDELSSVTGERLFTFDSNLSKNKSLLGFGSDAKTEKAQLQIVGSVSKELSQLGYSVVLQKPQQNVESLSLNPSMQLYVSDESAQGLGVDEFSEQISIKSDFTQSSTSFSRDSSLNLKTASLSQLPKIVSSMVSNNQESLTVRLKPYELGAIEIIVKEVAGEMSVTIRAERQSTVDALSQSESQMRDELDEKSSLSFSFSQHGSSERGENAQELFSSGSEVQEESQQVLETGLLSIVI